MWVHGDAKEEARVPSSWARQSLLLVLMAGLWNFSNAIISKTPAVRVLIGRASPRLVQPIRRSSISLVKNRRSLMQPIALAAGRPDPDYIGSKMMNRSEWLTYTR